MTLFDLPLYARVDRVTGRLLSPLGRIHHRQVRHRARQLPRRSSDRSLERFGARRGGKGVARTMSPHDTVRATIGVAQMRSTTAGRRSAGRKVLGNPTLFPLDVVWRTGADAATQFTTTASLSLAGSTSRPAPTPSGPSRTKTGATVDRQSAARAVGHRIRSRRGCRPGRPADRGPEDARSSNSPSGSSRSAARRARWSWSGKIPLDRRRSSSNSPSGRTRRRPRSPRSRRISATIVPCPTPTSPLLTQYRDIKARHPDAILFFRMGDFYEMFYDDAQIAARVLNITLTARGDGVPLAGVPVKAAAGYLRQFIAAGHRVAICEQIEDPKFAKGIVKRAVVETITPGAFLDDEWTPDSRNNWLVALAPSAGRVGLAALDLSTGEFLLETVAGDDLAEALGRLSPAEVVVPREHATVAIDPPVLQHRPRIVGVRSRTRHRGAGSPAPHRLARRTRPRRRRCAGRRRGRRPAALRAGAAAAGIAAPRASPPSVAATRSAGSTR